MKRLMLTLAMTVTMLTATAQEILVINDSYAISVNDIDSITYDVDTVYTNSLLPNMLAADPKVSIFYSALKMTGLADSLLVKYDETYPQLKSDSIAMIYFPTAVFDYSRATFVHVRYKIFTAFVETDSVLHLAGINNIDDLQQWAKRTYDEMYPEDASVADPTDQRNSLNRFVAYHLLRQATSYGWLVSCNQAIPNFILQVHDPSAYYETMMPHSIVKCSYKSNNGIYLNRRGLQNDFTVRGTRIMPIDANYSRIYNNFATNGVYFYIDSLIAYDKTTQKQVLNDSIRMDFKTLSPDIMNTNWENWWVNHIDFDFIAMKKDYVDCFQTDGDVVAFRPFLQSSYYFEGDVVVLPYTQNVTVKLPPLPAGTWQVRLGYNPGNGIPDVNTYIDGELQVSDINMRKSFTPDEIAADENLFPGPYDYSPYGDGRSMAEMGRSVRRVIGQFYTDGRQDHYLRLEADNRYGYLPLDYLEFYPVK